jgi:hypothetical protein
MYNPNQNHLYQQQKGSSSNSSNNSSFTSPWRALNSRDRAISAMDYTKVLGKATKISPLPLP